MLQEIVAGDLTPGLIEERGQEDFESEVNRPRLFQGVESVPGLTWPTITSRAR